MLRLFLILSKVILMLIAFSMPIIESHASDLLTIVIEDENGQGEKVIFYPAGTSYEVRNTSGQLSLPTEAFDGTLSFEGSVFLIVFPSYRKRPDEFQIGKGLRLYTTVKAAIVAGYAAKGNDEAIWVGDGMFVKSQSHHVIEIDRNHERISGIKELIESDNRAGKFNVRLQLSNGIRFVYIDGEVRAYLHKKRLTVEEGYIIPSEIGTLKVYFDPDDGEMYWIFEELQ